MFGINKEFLRGAGAQSPVETDFYSSDGVYKVNSDWPYNNFVLPLEPDQEFTTEDELFIFTSEDGSLVFIP
jgi:hypothetical protein